MCLIAESNVLLLAMIELSIRETFLFQEKYIRQSSITYDDIWSVPRFFLVFLCNIAHR